MLSSVLGKCCSVTPSIFVCFLPLQVFPYYITLYITYCILYITLYYIFYMGEKGDWDFRISDLVKHPCGEIQWSPEGPASQIHSPHLHVGAPGIFSDLLRSVQMLKREWGAESNGKLTHLFIPSKTAALVPEFAMEDLPSAELHPWFLALAVKDLPFGRTLWWWYTLVLSTFLDDF